MKQDKGKIGIESRSVRIRGGIEDCMKKCYFLYVACYSCGYTVQ